MTEMTVIRLKILLVLEVIAIARQGLVAALFRLGASSTAAATATSTIARRLAGGGAKVRITFLRIGALTRCGNHPLMG